MIARNGLVAHLMLAALLAWPTMALPEGTPVGRAAAFSCRAKIDERIHFHSADAAFISPERNRISSILAWDVRYLGSGIRNSLGGLADDERKACIEQATLVRRQLLGFFEARLRYLLASGDLARYDAESNNLYYAGIVAPMRAVSEEFIQQGLLDLRQKLQTTPWAAYARLNVRFELWNEAWARRHGSDAPGAASVDLQSAAVKTFDDRGRPLSPLALELFVFHELAHIVDPDYAPDLPGTRERTERYAWSETLAYIHYLKQTGTRIPEPFSDRILPNISLLGLDGWVSVVLKSLRRSGAEPFGLPARSLDVPAGPSIAR